MTTGVSIQYLVEWLTKNQDKSLDYCVQTLLSKGYFRNQISEAIKRYIMSPFHKG